MRGPRSLRARIALAAAAALLLTGVIVTPILLAEIEQDGREALDEELEERARAFGGPRGPGPLGRDGPGRGFGGRGGPPPPAGDRDLLSGSGEFVQVSLGGEVVERRGDVPENPPDVPDEDGFDTIEIDGESWRSLTLSPPGRPGGRAGGGPRVQLLSSLEPVDERVASIRATVLLLGALALGITGLAAWGFTGVAVRPLERLRAGAENVSGAEDLSTTLPEDDGPEEVRSLARTLNEMLARLRASTEAMERALAATRRFARDAGHELRTPLTGMRANLDVLERNPGLEPGERQALVADVIAEQDRIVHLLDGLQALARGDAAESLAREDVELGDLVDSALFAARRRHPRVTYELEESIERAAVRGWGGGLRLLVDNLLDNAALHGRSGGKVRVGLERADGSLLVRVDDDGPGIPQAERARLLEPFERGPGANASGTGLGLAIVAQQVALHGGTIDLGDSRLGGLAVAVHLPLATSSG